MNTSNTFLRYFNTENEQKEVFVSIADLEYSGCPIDENGDDLDNDESLYRFNHQTQTYEKIVWHALKNHYINTVMKEFKCTYIDWDTDGEAVNLPASVVIEAEDEDSIADALSDKYGWCVSSFFIEQ